MKRFIPIKYYISIVKDKLKEELKEARIKSSDI